MNERDCKHGHFARSCEICDLETECAAWKARAERYEKALEAIINTAHHNCTGKGIAKHALAEPAMPEEKT